MNQNILTRVWNSIFKRDNNKFNQAFLFGGSGFTSYDPNGYTYLEKGYNLNSIVYSVINQQATKTASIPYYIKKIEDKNAHSKLRRLNASSNDLSIQQKIKKTILESKAYQEDEFEFPLENPNPNQTWTEFHALYKTFLALTGNVYLYILSAEEGMNKGVPMAIYLLPSHDMQIVLKDKANLLGIESPIKSYILIQGKQYIDFEVENVIHIKYSNPNYDENGSHLYGQSPLEAVLRNIQSSNKGIDLNIKTLQNGGAFGFIHGKNIPLQEEQAKEIKERLSEMNDSPEDLAKIAGISSEIGFTRLSLTASELKPFDYLDYDQKQICNALGWSDKLLNNSESSDYGGTVSQYRKQVITDNIQPDLMLLADALNNYFLPRFKGYEGTEIIYDISELPEMQQDTKTMVEWTVQLLDRGVLNRNEAREIVNFPKSEDVNMEVYTVANDVLTLEEAIESEFNIPNE